MNLAAEIEKFDGVHTDVLESAAQQLKPTPADVRTLLKLTADADVNRSVGASWLLKHLASAGHRFTEAQSAKVLSLLEGEHNWQTALHLVQAFPALTIAPETAGAWHTRLTALACDRQNFLRAWSFNALAVLATEHAELRESIVTRLDEALHSDAASVRARIRNVVRRTPWLRGALDV